MTLRTILATTYKFVGHSWGQLSRRYYFEDFVRVYPDGLVRNRLGFPKASSQNDINNFKNHTKFYRFAAQFVRNESVVDIGCGSGYSSKLMRDAGASQFHGVDVSTSAIRFAKQRFSEFGTFEVAPITKLATIADGTFGVTICSEVLEHILEYHREKEAVQELKRITRPGGLIVIGTPNAEMLPEHGFSFQQIRELMEGAFSRFVIFENALLPYGDARKLWEQRVTTGDLGVVLTQDICTAEVVDLYGQPPTIKKGDPVGTTLLGSLTIDNSLLHNTHSWVVVAIVD